MVVSRRDRRSNVEVTVLDLDRMMADLLKLMKDSGKYDDVLRVSLHGSSLGYVDTPKGMFLLDRDACGPGGSEEPVTEENPAEFPIYMKRDEKSIPLFPDGSFKMTSDELREYATDETENLGEWVRKFGHRLECNFDNWNKFLEGLLGIQPAKAK